MQMSALAMAIEHGKNSAAHVAFRRLKPITPDYPVVPIDEGFNWSQALQDIDAGAWYLVVFRSLRKADADTAVLTEFDDHAHIEAMQGDGLLHYFQGQLNIRRECLSFCVWESREHALIGATKPLHAAAAGLAARMYDHFRLERYTIAKHDHGSVLIERVLNEPAPIV